jgi:hypothetical protein
MVRRWRSIGAAIAPVFGGIAILASVTRCGSDTADAVDATPSLDSAMDSPHVDDVFSIDSPTNAAGALRTSFVLMRGSLLLDVTADADGRLFFAFPPSTACSSQGAPAPELLATRADGSDPTSYCVGSGSVFFPPGAETRALALQPNAGRIAVIADSIGHAGTLAVAMRSDAGPSGSDPKWVDVRDAAAPKGDYGTLGGAGISNGLLVAGRSSEKSGLALSFLPDGGSIAYGDSRFTEFAAATARDSGYLIGITSDQKAGIIEMLADGTPNPSFATSGLLTFGSGIVAVGIAIDSLGRLIAIDTDARATITVSRFLPNGVADTSFGGGSVTLPISTPQHDRLWVAVDASDRVIVPGLVGGQAMDPFQHGALVRLTADGKLDPTFGAGGQFTTSNVDLTSSAEKAFVAGSGSVAEIVLVTSESNGPTTVYRVTN